MLYREIIAVCSEIRTEHINTLCGQNVESLNVKLVVHIVTTVQSLIPHRAVFFNLQHDFIFLNTDRPTDRPTDRQTDRQIAAQNCQSDKIPVLLCGQKLRNIFSNDLSILKHFTLAKTYAL